jgi:hypothetical protein
VGDDPEEPLVERLDDRGGAVEEVVDLDAGAPVTPSPGDTAAAV